MFDLSYVKTIELRGPTWTALVDSLHDAIKVVEDTADIVKAIRANTDTLEALETALALDNGSVELGGSYQGAALLPDEALNDGDIVVMGRLQQNRVLITCHPWHSDWVKPPFYFDVRAVEEKPNFDDERV